MLNEERIRSMTKLARYDEGPGKEALRIQGMYRSDYIGMALIKNFFSVTIGYALVLALIGVYYFEYLMEELHHLNLPVLIAEILLGYAIVLVVYMVITYIICSVRYERTKKSVHSYNQELGKLEKQYRAENAKTEVSGTAKNESSRARKNKKTIVK